jgi:hypothetical protein
MELIAATPGSRSNNLVFTSAGDRSSLLDWRQGRQGFDLWTVYYVSWPVTAVHPTAKLRYTHFNEQGREHRSVARRLLARGRS